MSLVSVRGHSLGCGHSGQSHALTSLLSLPAMDSMGYNWLNGVNCAQTHEHIVMHILYLFFLVFQSTHMHASLPQIQE